MNAVGDSDFDDLTYNEMRRVVALLGHQVPTHPTRDELVESLDGLMPPAEVQELAARDDN